MGEADWDAIPEVTGDVDPEFPDELQAAARSVRNAGFEDLAKRLELAAKRAREVAANG